jgi:hypothetical protein
MAWNATLAQSLRWLPWPSTWIAGQDPAEAMYSDARDMGYYRFQVRDEPLALQPGQKGDRLRSKTLVFASWLCVARR